ncbi:MAG: PIN domain nuclease [Acidimicrobiia bacterium]|nr:PIN domain nuclease [Acidimicrobiia bacterium]MDH5521881.1 PIN domain nuclease [Acidimicrobiia bacterium]
MTGLYLADKSALEQRRHSQAARDLLALLLSEGALASNHVIALEVLYSARNLDDYERLKNGIEALPWLPVDEHAMDRAMEVQHHLARRGRHRLPLPELMIAASAELHGATVLHYDHDYDLIAAVTGQPTQWIVRKGSGG